MKRKKREILLLDLRYDACGWRIGDILQLHVTCLWMMSIALQQTAAKRTREQTSYEAMKPLGYEEERGAPGHLCDESLSRKRNRKGSDRDHVKTSA